VLAQPHDGMPTHPTADPSPLRLRDRDAMFTEALASTPVMRCRGIHGRAISNTAVQANHGVHHGQARERKMGGRRGQEAPR
jgi:hypothetical protein